MVRFAVATIFLAVLMGSLVSAQDATPKIQVFGGYSLVNEPRGGLTDLALDADLRQPPNTFGVSSLYTGWNAEAQYNTGRWLSLVADFGGRYGKPFTAVNSVTGLPNSSAYSVLAGPAISYRTKSSFTPFIHALFGWDRTSLSASTIAGPSSAVSTAATSYTDFAMALGGGFDYKISKRFSLRPVQLDYFHTSVNLNSYYGSAYGIGLFQGLTTHQVNLRYSGGIVIKF